MKHISVISGLQLTNKVVTEETGTEDVYIIPNMNPKPVIMSEEMIRRQNEDILRNKHGAKKNKSAIIM